MQPQLGRERPSIGGPEEAERVLAAFAGTIAELESVLDAETEDLSSGRIRSALSREERKSDLAAGYLRGLELVRANAVALARFAPEAAGRLRHAHRGFRAALERNQAVIATARAVSEGLVKGVADEMARQSRPAGYGVSTPQPATGSPLVYSRRF
ncbi:hypothetical protein [Enterovirga rhinocerotis]|uniref:FlgN protein n=1 Tax=Enterovirga rhinocerotis TaxID=1339210 RepID=A0A4R7C8H1_9HYPH|nr:hypothetical protein [Enterovirga rhinocerotis]TDR93146.1 hypothetical protein EV668_0400 [Enterovirga rhinocerotis]